MRAGMRPDLRVRALLALLAAIALLLHGAARPLPQLAASLAIGQSLCASHDRQTGAGLPGSDLSDDCRACCAQSGSADPLAGTLAQPHFVAQAEQAGVLKRGRAQGAPDWAQGRPRAPPYA